MIETDAERAQYDAIEAVNWSRLRLLEKSPMHFKQGWGDDSSGFKLGTAEHMAVLEPERFASLYVVTDIRRDKRTKAWNEYEEEQTRQGKIVLIQSEYDKVIAMRDAILGNARAAAYLKHGQPEQALQWKLEGGGISFNCKGRLDFIGDEAIVDIKTTQSSNPREFSRSAGKYGYFGQAAFYSDGLFLARRQRKPFVIIAVESAPPYIVTVFRVPESVIAFGRDQYLSLLGKLDYCQRNGWWGGYTETEEVDLEVPSYMESAE